MNKYLLDTNILSELLKPQPNKKVASLMAVHNNRSVTATVVIQELVFGYQCLPISKRRLEIERYVNHLISSTIILPYTLEAAIWHGEERARLNKLGKPSAFADGQIAAIAKVNDLILVTRNTSDFRYFAGIDIENWFMV
jgi:tRNA(fMet)-specific endonuclease VapC